MANTKRYKDLIKRLAELRKHMIPSDFSPTGDYTDRQIDRVRGYRLLVHAEIEYFIENSAKDLVQEKVTEWNKHGKPSAVIVSLMACYHSGWVYGDDVANEEIIQLARSRKNVKEKSKDIVEAAFKQYLKNISDNHGIKEQNLRSLIIPTGLYMDDLDPTWITSMNEFGKQRGDIAHKSNKVHEMINPQDEYKRVKDMLLPGIKDLDSRLLLMYKK